MRRELGKLKQMRHMRPDIALVQRPRTKIDTAQSRVFFSWQSRAWYWGASKNRHHGASVAFHYLGRTRSAAASNAVRGHSPNPKDAVRGPAQQKRRGTRCTPSLKDAVRGPHPVRKTRYAVSYDHCELGTRSAHRSQSSVRACSWLAAGLGLAGWWELWPGWFGPWGPVKMTAAMHSSAGTRYAVVNDAVRGPARP